MSTYSVSGQAGLPTRVDINRTGQFIRIQLNDQNYLSLAEVEVFGTPGTPPPPVELAAVAVGEMVDVLSTANPSEASATESDQQKRLRRILDHTRQDLDGSVRFV